jgi:hypothetical protein
VKRLALALLLAACAAAPDGKPIAPPVPDRDRFLSQGVSLFLEARCGSLDCHGQDGRPLRLYSKDGLRRLVGDGGLRDTSDTTPLERLENYRSVIGLEPEEMKNAMASPAGFDRLLLLKKPLDVSGRGVRHKGGQVLSASDSDPGWVCLTSWIQGRDGFAKSCSDAADLRP